MRKDVCEGGKVDAGLPQERRDEPSRLLVQVKYLGLSFWWMWVFLMYGGGMLSLTVEDASLLVRSYELSTLAVALVSCLIALLGHRAQALLSRPSVLAVLGVMASGGTALVLAGGAWGAELPLYVGNAMTGFGTGAIALRCALQFCELPPRNSSMMTALMMALALLACALFLTLDARLLSAVMVALPLLAALFSFIGDAGPLRSRATAYTGNPAGAVLVTFGMLLLILLVFLVAGIVPFVLGYEVFSIRSTTCLFIGLCLCALIVVAAALLPNDLDFIWLYFILLAGFLLFYLVVLAGQIRAASLVLFFSNASIALNLIAWSFLACVGFFAGRLALPVFGFGRAAVAGSAALSWFIGSHELFAGNGLFAAFLVGELVVFIVAVAVIVVSCRRRGAGLPLAADVAETMASLAPATQTPAAEGESAEEGLVGAATSASPSSGPEANALSEAAPVLPSRWRLRVMLLADTVGLTKREADVFVLLAKGKDAQQIADELTVSLSTVRTHVRSIYAKCDVHSRREFQQFVDERSRALEGEGPSSFR